LIPNILLAQQETQRDSYKELIGTWVNEQKGEGEIPSQILKYVFGISESGEWFSEFYWMVKRTQDNEYITVAAVIGSLSIEQNVLKLKTTKAGSQLGANGYQDIYKEIKWFANDDVRFSMVPQQSEYYFQINGNLLEMKSDDNQDGDYDDEGETTVFTKKE